MRFVVAVAEERNFSRAAARCNISQPALSRRVQEVEEELGTRLFERQTRRVIVTPAGRLFVREAQRTLEQSHRTVSLVEAFAKRQDRSLVIGISQLADLPVFYPLIDNARRSAPSVSITVRTAFSSELILDLLRGDADLAIIDQPATARGIRFHQLAAEPLVVALPERLSVSSKPAINLSELTSAPLVLLSCAVDPGRTSIDRALSTIGARGFRIREAASVPELLDEVAIHGRIGLLRQPATRLQRQGVVYKPLAETIQVGYALSWRADDRRPALASLRDALIAFSGQP